MVVEQSFWTVNSPAILILLLLGLATYIYTALALYRIAKRTGTGNAWLAFFPIGNIYLMTDVGNLPKWVTLGFLVIFMGGYIGVLALAMFHLILFGSIAMRLKRPVWQALLVLLPIANYIILAVWAWGKDKEEGLPEHIPSRVSD